MTVATHANRLIRLVLLGAVAAAITLVGLVLLPHDRYVRWQSMTVEAFARLGWIYERIHFDQTPIDIAFIGTSHTMNGVDAAAVEQRLCQEIVGAQPCPHTVNLAVPQYGRNIHWLIARELLENRKVKTLVLEVLENETRKAHPMFIYVADAKDVLTAPALINVGYFSDLVRLPWRQLSLAARSLQPEWFGLQSQFNPARYDGSQVDNTRTVSVHGKAITGLRDRVMDPDRLRRESDREMARKDLNLLPAAFERFEYAVPHTYVRKILELAEAKGVEVKFLYFPGFGRPERPMDMRLYAGRGDMLFLNDVLARPENWFDTAHLNLQGAAQASQRIGELFGERIKASQAAAKDAREKTNPVR